MMLSCRFISVKSANDAEKPHWRCHQDARAYFLSMAEQISVIERTCYIHDIFHWLESGFGTWAPIQYKDVVLPV